MSTKETDDAQVYIKPSYTYWNIVQIWALVLTLPISGVIVTLFVLSTLDKDVLLAQPPIETLEPVVIIEQMDEFYINEPVVDTSPSKQIMTTESVAIPVEIKEETPFSKTISIFDASALLQECQQHFRARRFIPKRSNHNQRNNALDCYKEILIYDNDNKAAKSGIKKLEDQYIKWAQRFLNKGNYHTAEVYIENLELINKDSPALLELYEKLERSKRKHH